MMCGTTRKNHCTIYESPEQLLRRLNYEENLRNEIKLARKHSLLKDVIRWATVVGFWALMVCISPALVATYFILFFVVLVEESL